MEEREYFIALYDYYGKLLTEKQKQYFEDYFFDNLTMEEIAENDNVSKNAVSKQIIIIKDKLDFYEEKLKLNYNKKKIINILSNTDYLSEVSKYI